MEKFKPLMPKSGVNKRRKWQNHVWNCMEAIKEKKDINVPLSFLFNNKLCILPGMFPPNWGDSILLAEIVYDKIKQGEVVLDMGTGSGLQGIVAAENAKKVISVDINPVAVKCARINAKRFGIQSKMTVKKGDLFSSVVNEKFSTILYNPAFRWFKPRDMKERAATDEEYNSLNKFFAESSKHLIEGGRILLVFSNSGDIKYLYQLIDKYKYSCELIIRRKTNGWTYFVFELKPICGNILIRKATQEDLPEIFRIEKKSYPPELQTTHEILRFRFTNFGIWVAEYDGKVVGFFTCVPAKIESSSIAKFLEYRHPHYKKWFTEYLENPSNCDSLYITSTAVDSEFQNKGIGRRLVLYSLELTKKLGLKKRISILRLPGLNKFLKNNLLSVENYLELVKNGQCHDRFLSLYLNLGFELGNIIPNYEVDRSSRGYGILSIKNVL